MKTESDEIYYFGFTAGTGSSVSPTWFIGRSDKNGVPIKCGDCVLVTERRAKYLATSTEDGWGRDIPLCRHDHYIVPEEIKVSRGTIVYSEHFCGFRVHFIDRWPDEDFVYMFREIEVVPK
jgi:hypothetical protein